MLQKQKRVSRKQFALLLRPNTTLTSPHFSLRVYKNIEQKAACAIVISKKVVQKASERNVLRRRMFEIVAPLLTKNTHILYAKQGSKELSFQELKMEIQALFQKVR